LSRVALVLILVSVTISALAQILLKAGMSAPAVQRGLAIGPSPGTVAAVFFHPAILGGLCLYFLSALVWLLVLARVQVSLAYPFVALGFVLTAVLGRMVFGEALSPIRIAGTLLICAGVVLLARS
jgi:multidrug transporter EmrE-like cation transporter